MSARRRIASWKLWGIVLLCLAAIALVGSKSAHKAPAVSSLCLNRGVTPDIAHCNIYTEIVSTPEAREKGFSGREPSSGGDAMLFVFDTPSTYCMWMKDMKFALDIAWVNHDGKILTLIQNISPDTYPKQYCHEGSYVLEVTAGRSRSLGIVPGAVLDL